MISYNAMGLTILIKQIHLFRLYLTVLGSEIKNKKKKLENFIEGFTLYQSVNICATQLSKKKCCRVDYRSDVNTIVKCR